MVNYWIFVISNVRPNRVTFENSKKFKNLLSKNPYWGLSSRTQYVNQLEKNDKGVFYLAGEDSHSFIASFEIDSEAYKLSIEEKKKLNPDLTYFSSSCVNIRNIKVFKKPVKIYELLKLLDMTRNQTAYGYLLQGGVRKITEGDYKKIANRP